MYHFSDWIWDRVRTNHIWVTASSGIYLHLFLGQVNIMTMTLSAKLGVCVRVVWMLSRLCVSWKCVVIKFCMHISMKWQKACTTNKSQEIASRSSWDQLILRKEPIWQQEFCFRPKQCTVSSSHAWVVGSAIEISIYYYYFRWGGGGDQ